MSQSRDSIPYHDQIDYEQFQDNVNGPNVPLLIGPDFTRRWRCMYEWRTPCSDLDSSPSHDPSIKHSPKYLPNLLALRKFSHHLVSVTDTSARIPHTGYDTEERLLGDVLDTWERGRNAWPDGDGEGKGLYVKDWHLALEIENDGGSQEEVYVTPDIFRDDWLTPYYLSLPSATRIQSRPDSQSVEVDEMNRGAASTTLQQAETSAAPITPLPPTPPRSDYRFSYLGPAGTFTPFHCDVYNSWSWSCNVVGRKRWWFVPPDVRKGDNEGSDDKQEGRRFEGVIDLRELPQDQLKDIWIVDQEPGETIFVPSGWSHQVLNLDFCISINQNFLSSLCLPSVYAALLESKRKVEESIDDVKDMIRERVGDGLVGEDVGGTGTNAGSVTGDTERDNGSSATNHILKTEKLPRHSPHVYQWEVEWAEQVESLLEMDAGWGVRVFWNMVLYNLKTPVAPPHLRPEAQYTHAQLDPIIDDFKGRREYVVLAGVAAVVRAVEKELPRGS